MTAVVNREHAKATWLTGAAGSLTLAAAFAMMVFAAPSPSHARPHGAATLTVTQSVTIRCHQLASRSDSTAVRACRTGPSAVSAWAEPYTSPKPETSPGTHHR
jgi:hypothetical protein